jgi:hypothetical protein
MTAQPTARSLLRYVIDSNPFYLISACCMLGGCVALTNSLSWLSISTSRLVLLIATLNIYEATVIGLAAYLLLVRGLRRDGMVLVMVEAFFFIDITFLNAEISTQKSWIGPVLAVLCFLAAAAKLAVILHLLGARRRYAEFIFVLIQIAAILAVPILFARTPDGHVSPLAFYGGWGLVGLMPAVYKFLAKYLNDEEASPLTPSLIVFTLLPALSLATHLGILHYVYDVSFYGPMAAPVLLGAAMVLSFAHDVLPMPRTDIGLLQVLLPIAAIIVSASCPGELTIYTGRLGHFSFTTLRLTLIAAYLEFIYSFLRPYWHWATAAGVASMLTVAYGPTPGEIVHWYNWLWNAFSEGFENVLPATPEGWGAMLVVLAFIFLGLGAVVSLGRRAPAQQAVDLPPDASANKLPAP